jgi:menaquinone-dependent protoporphyrinogen oxidase
VPTALVAYSTTHGHTAKVARHVGEVLTTAGFDVRVDELEKHGPTPDPSEFDAVVVAGSIHAGHHQSHLTDWMRDHARSLAARPDALLSVSLTAADDTDEARETTRRLMDELADDTGWTPDRTLAVAGALQYHEYDLPTRVLMRLIARSHGASTDASHDVDYTDWDALDRFVADFAAAALSDQETAAK